MPSVGQTVDGVIDLLAGGEKGFRAFSGLLQAGMMQAAASGAGLAKPARVGCTRG